MLLGRPAPDFRMLTTKDLNTLEHEARLADYHGRWLVLFFYPADFTFVCPTEVQAFSEAVGAFAERNADVLGVSTDGIFSHVAWMEFHIGQLNFPLASDRTQQVSRDYGVLDDEGQSARAVFVIEPGREQVRFQRDEPDRQHRRDHGEGGVVRRVDPELHELPRQQGRRGGDRQHEHRPLQQRQRIQDPRQEHPEQRRGDEHRQRDAQDPAGTCRQPPGLARRDPRADGRDLQRDGDKQEGLHAAVRISKPTPGPGRGRAVSGTGFPATGRGSRGFA